MPSQAFEKEDFDAAKHLAFTPPEKVTMMEDLGFKDVGVSPVAVSEPFQLFSKEAVEQMRYEILDPELKAKHGFHSNIAASQMRGYCPEKAPFTYDAWTHPETLAVISKIAGIDLIPVMNYEIANINFSARTEAETRIAGCPWEDDKPIVGWHNDSYPFVCVLMLSDCTNMVGGETALRTANGDILKVRGPSIGCAVVLQGRYINHQALRALGGQERITAVTSFRPKSITVRDDTILKTVRPISDLNELYFEFAEYRLQMVQDRIDAQLRTMRARRRAGKKIDTLGVKKFLEEQEQFLSHTNGQIVEEDKVQVGHFDLDEAGDCADNGTPIQKRARVV
ncbi:hypothetical protein EJ08DRAFT_605062 [Tothia fuscella]|uniref:Fe2OG dioxygenase domain-containing protein n=1 Tax=Tothia fuscella TaxID=1048955 RepID=A0A9P4NZA5_9PEZI|nr:hypothetical protein EJ08DRAFT_605062 [Tothia fuscella]